MDHEEDCRTATLNHKQGPPQARALWREPRYQDMEHDSDHDDRASATREDAHYLGGKRRRGDMEGQQRHEHMYAHSNLDLRRMECQGHDEVLQRRADDGTLRKRHATGSDKYGTADGQLGVADEKERYTERSFDRGRGAHGMTEDRQSELYNRLNATRGHERDGIRYSDSKKGVEVRDIETDRYCWKATSTTHASDTDKQALAYTHNHRYVDTDQRNVGRSQNIQRSTDMDYTRCTDTDRYATDTERYVLGTDRNGGYAVNRTNDQLTARSIHTTRGIGRDVSMHREVEVHASARDASREGHWNSDSELGRNFHKDGRSDKYGEAERERVSRRNMDRDHTMDTYRDSMRATNTEMDKNADGYMHRSRDMDVHYGTCKDKHTEASRDALYDTMSNIGASRGGDRQEWSHVRTHRLQDRHWDQHAAAGVANREELNHNYGLKNTVRDLESGRTRHLGGAEGDGGTSMDMKRLRDVDADMLGEVGRGQNTRRHTDNDLITAAERRERGFNALMPRHVGEITDQDRQTTNVDTPFLRHSDATCQKASHVDSASEVMTDEKRSHAAHEVLPEARGSRGDSECVQQVGMMGREGKGSSVCAQEDTVWRKDRMHLRLRTQQSEADMQVEPGRDARTGDEEALETTAERQAAEVSVRADGRTEGERDVWRDKASRPHEQEHMQGMHTKQISQNNIADGVRAHVLSGTGTSNGDDSGLGTMLASTPRAPRTQIAATPTFTQTPQSRAAGAARQDCESRQKCVEDTCDKSRESRARDTDMMTTPVQMVKERDALESGETSGSSRIMCAQEQFENSNNSSAAESAAVQCTQVCVCVCVGLTLVQYDMSNTMMHACMLAFCIFCTRHRDGGARTPSVHVLAKHLTHIHMHVRVFVYIYTHYMHAHICKHIQHTHTYKIYHAHTYCSAHTCSIHSNLRLTS
jgi:hypothetical protein